MEESGCRPLSAQRGWRLGAVELAEVVVHLEGGGDDDDDVDVGDNDGVDYLAIFNTMRNMLEEN